MKALVGAFNQEKALVGAFSVIVQPVVEPMEHYTALITGHCFTGDPLLTVPGCSQPNDQARVVAPVVGGTEVRRMMTGASVSTLLIVRHPFDR